MDSNPAKAAGEMGRSSSMPFRATSEATFCITVNASVHRPVNPHRSWPLICLLAGGERSGYGFRQDNV